MLLSAHSTVDTLADGDPMLNVTR